MVKKKTINGILFDGSLESAQAIADALAPRRVEHETVSGGPRLILAGRGRVSAIYVYPGEYVFVPKR